MKKGTVLKHSDGKTLNRLKQFKSKKSKFNSFTTPEKERKEKVGEAIRLYQSEIESIVLNADKWQNKN